MNVKASAKGMASQTPFTCHKADKIRIPSTVKKKVLEKEMPAEVFPSESAVNSAEAKILIPANRKEKAKSLSPPAAITATAEPEGAKTPAIKPELRNATAKINTEQASTKPMHIRYSL